MCALGLSTARNDASSADSRARLIRAGTSQAGCGRAARRVNGITGLSEARRGISRAPFRGERELDQPVEVVAQRRGADPGAAERDPGTTVVVVHLVAK